MMTVAAFLAFALAAPAQVGPAEEDCAPWVSEKPAGCPFEQSEDYRGVCFTERYANYTTADTWYPSWAENGKLYSPYTDGAVDGVLSISDGTWQDQGAENTMTGQAVIEGDDPMQLEVKSLGVEVANAAPYMGRYPCGTLVHDGVWYYGTYCLGPHSTVEHEGFQYNWPWLGPFVGFRISEDYGETWTDCPHTPAEPIFGESGLEGKPVKIGAPHFVDFGKNMEHSADGKAYLVAQGASEGPEGRRFAYNSWVTADQVYLLRATPSVETMNDPAAYEFYGGKDANGEPVWTGDLAEAKPLLEWKNNMGCVTATYVPGIGRYIMCVTDGQRTRGAFHTYLLEAPELTGPWKLVQYMRNFGEQAYFVNIPSKFISEDGKTMWMCYSANFSASQVPVEEKPAGSRYAMSLHEMKLLPAAQ